MTEGLTLGSGSGTNDNVDSNGEKWTKMDELDAAEREKACDEDGLGGEESQLPDDLANSFNVTMRTIPSTLKTYLTTCTSLYTHRILYFRLEVQPQ